MKKLAYGLVLISASVLASDADVIKSLEKLGYKANELVITNSEVKGVKSILSPEGLFYMTDDGKYLTSGPIYKFDGDKPMNIANAQNKDLIKSIGDDAIVFKAKNEKYVIYVFTDYTCGFCQQLHENINQYLDAGISVHYFAFPRAGLGSDVAKNMQSIWSSSDPKAAFNNAYKGLPIPPATNKKDYITEQYTVGNKLGISGTPAIVLSNGQLISGYVPADQLLNILSNTFDKK